MLKNLASNLRSIWFGRRLRGQGARLEGPVSLIGGLFPLLKVQGTMNVGSGTIWQGVSWRTEIHVAATGALEVGAGTFINQGVTIAAHEAIIIGGDCLIGEHAAIHDTTFHPVSPGRPVKKVRVRIGRNVWLGHRVIVLPGVEIGDHSIVGAGAVVSRTLPPRCVAAGVPARVLSTFDCPDDWKRA
jgi:acetyltransferase-like isoleucine patch superfamily enzyme